VKKKFYLTTTLPYVNADPHIGFAMELVRADVLVRYHRDVLGEDVFFNTGTDEHGAKIYKAAEEAGKDVQIYVDEYAAQFEKLTNVLNLAEPNFIRTTDMRHVKAAQEMWKRCRANGFISDKKVYKVRYCTGCELEKTDSELLDGKCPIHPNREIEIREEENYFFKFSEFGEKLKDFYRKNPTFVVPDFRFNEIKALVERGLEDFSISRLKKKMPWGVPVPGDEEHVMYVWFDALTSYISTLGWPDDEEKFRGYWENGTPVQYCGKDNLRQQSAMWQAILMAAGLPPSSHIVINGFVTSGGQKMSKSLGNVLNPFDVIEYFKPYTDFPEDVLRFALLYNLSSFEDGDITLQSIKESYTANLVNGLGNLTNRIMKLSVDYAEKTKGINNSGIVIGSPWTENFKKTIESFDLRKSIEGVFASIHDLDQKIQKEQAYKVIKENVEDGWALVFSQKLYLGLIAQQLSLFFPRTSAKILECIRENKMPEKPLFARLTI